MESSENNTTPTYVTSNEIESLGKIWSVSKKEAIKSHLSGTALTDFMLGKVNPVVQGEKRLRLYRGTTSRPIVRNSVSRTNFDNGLPGEYWTFDMEKAKRYHNSGGRLFQVDITAEELCNRSLISVTDSFDEFRVLSKEIQERAQQL